MGRAKYRPALAGLCLAAAVAVVWAQDPETVPAGPVQVKTPERVHGIGVKIGEVYSDRAVLWTRTPPKDPLDPQRSRNWRRSVLSLLRGGEMQVRYRLAAASSPTPGAWSDWESVDQRQDYIHQFELEDLEPGVAYRFEVQAADMDDRPTHQPRVGRFRTAPPADDPARVVFTVVTGQRYDRIDDSRGFQIYPAMQALNPDFLVLTGDTVYLDRGGVAAVTYRQALNRWRRMYALPWLRDFHAVVPAYWQKDDHDVLRDDAYPGIEPLGALTFEKGLQVFRLHTPKAERPYRQVRWGALAEIWLTEVREFRSANRSKDGPNKTIFGERQKRWLKQTLPASSAAWRILVNPTPIVGPDRADGKADNHANDAFRTEGREIRTFLAGLGDNFLLLAGDRHWQYHSVHPETGLHELGCGPASDAHAGGSPLRRRIPPLPSGEGRLPVGDREAGARNDGDGAPSCSERRGRP